MANAHTLVQERVPVKPVQMTTYEFLKRINMPQHLYKMTRKYEFAYQFQSEEKDKLKPEIGDDKELELLMQVIKNDAKDVSTCVKMN